VLYRVSSRRVQQLVKEYRDSGQVPKLDWMRRPSAEITAEQKSAIDRVWDETRRGSRLLYFELKKRGVHVPKNKLHAYLRHTGRTVPNPRKQKKRKRCRYVRKHSGSLLHTDWHRKSESHPYAIAFLDDASRKVVACGEFDSANAENSVRVLRMAIAHCQEYSLQIQEINTDRGSHFYNNKSELKSEFEAALEDSGIRHIPSSPNNPQTNGKLERLWYEYDRHRFRFDTFAAFVHWYNGLIHGELDFQSGETPEEAFVRKLPDCSLVGMFGRLINW
jgi:putative transposase